MPSCTTLVEMIYVLLPPSRDVPGVEQEGMLDAAELKLYEMSPGMRHMVDPSLLNSPFSLFPRMTAWLDGCPLFVGGSASPAA